MKTKTGPTPGRLMELAWGYAPTLVVEAAVHFRVFDCLLAGARTAQQLARQTGAALRGVTALLDALVGLKLLRRQGQRYGLTDESAAFLVSGTPEYRGAFFRHHTTQLLPMWMQLRDVIRTGRPAARTDRQDRGAEYFAEFVESLFPVSFSAASALGRHLGLTRSRAPVRVLDLGAGSGVWGIALAQLSAHVQVRAVDWPKVLEITRKVATRHGVIDRLTCVSGDLFSADFGGGHQVAVLGHILHSESPARCQELLRKTFAALAPGGIIAIQEFVPNDDRTGPAHALLFAINMLVNTDAGGTYTAAEIGGWLRHAGFVHPRQLETPGPSPLILADKPPAARHRKPPAAPRRKTGPPRKR